MYARLAISVLKERRDHDLAQLDHFQMRLVLKFAIDALLVDTALRKLWKHLVNFALRGTTVCPGLVSPTQAVPNELAALARTARFRTCWAPSRRRLAFLVHRATRALWQPQTQQGSFAPRGISVQRGLWCRCSATMVRIGILSAALTLMTVPRVLRVLFAPLEASIPHDVRRAHIVRRDRKRTTTAQLERIRQSRLREFLCPKIVQLALRASIPKWAALRIVLNAIRDTFVYLDQSLPREELGAGLLDRPIFH